MDCGLAHCVWVSCLGFLLLLTDTGEQRAGRPCKVPVDIKVFQEDRRWGKGNSLQRSTEKLCVKQEAQCGFFKGDLTLLHAPKNFPQKTPGGHLSLSLSLSLSLWEIWIQSAWSITIYKEFPSGLSAQPKLSTTVWEESQLQSWSVMRREAGRNGAGIHSTLHHVSTFHSFLSPTFLSKPLCVAVASGLWSSSAPPSDGLYQ